MPRKTANFNLRMDPKLKAAAEKAAAEAGVRFRL